MAGNEPRLDPCGCPARGRLRKDITTKYEKEVRPGHRTYVCQKCTEIYEEPEPEPDPKRIAEISAEVPPSTVGYWAHVMGLRPYTISENED